MTKISPRMPKKETEKLNYEISSPENPRANINTAAQKIAELKKLSTKDANYIKKKFLKNSQPENMTEVPQYFSSGPSAGVGTTCYACGGCAVCLASPAPDMEAALIVCVISIND